MKDNTKIAPPRLWTRYFVLIMIVNTLFSFVFFSQSTITTLFTQYLGGSNITAGIAMAALTIAALISRPLLGKFIDRKGRRLILILGVALMALITLLSIWVGTVGMLIFFNFFRGFSISATATASGTIVADQVPRSRLSEGIGFYGITTTLATALAPTFAIAFAERKDFATFYQIGAVVMVICLGVVLLIDYEKKTPPPLITAEQPKKERTRLIEKNALRPAIVNTLFIICQSSIVSLLPAYAVEKDIKSIALYYIVSSAAILLTRFFAGRLGDRFGIGWVVLPAMLLPISAFTILTFATELPAILVGAVLMGLGVGAIQPSMQALAIKLCKPENRGIANATFFTSADVGFGVGALVWGAVSQVFGYPYIFAASAVLSLINIGVFVQLIIRHRPFAALQGNKI